MIKSEPVLWPYSTETPDLKLHELEFKPRPLTTENSDLVYIPPVQLIELQNELNCPICLDIMTNTVVTKCLHRYCRECIHRYLSQIDYQERKCPLCKENVNKRALKQDERMDFLISLFFPEKQNIIYDLVTDKRVFRERHKEQVGLMRQQSKLNLTNRQCVEKEKRRRNELEINSDDSGVTANKLLRSNNSNRISQQSSAHNHSKISTSLIKFVICKHPGERILPDISNGMVQTDMENSATILDAKNFVFEQLSSMNYSSFEINDFEFIITYPGDNEDEGDIPPSSVTLSNNSITIAQIAPIFHEKALMMVLLYSLTTEGKE